MVIGVVTCIIIGLALSDLVSWHETNLKLETVRIQTSPMGLEISRNERDRAMFDAMPRPMRPGHDL